MICKESGKVERFGFIGVVVEVATNGGDGLPPLRYGNYNDAIKWSRYLYRNGVKNPANGNYYNLADIADLSSFPRVHLHKPFKNASMMGRNSKAFRVSSRGTTFGYGNVQLINNGRYASDNYIEGFSFNVSEKFGLYQIFLHNNTQNNAVMFFRLDSMSHFKSLYKYITGDDFIFKPEYENKWWDF